LSIDLLLLFGSLNPRRHASRLSETLIFEKPRFSKNAKNGFPKGRQKVSKMFPKPSKLLSKKWSENKQPPEAVWARKLIKKGGPTSVTTPQKAVSFGAFFQASLRTPKKLGLETYFERLELHFRRFGHRF
jgi:hypothetical protein